MGPYCKYCGRRCFTPLATGDWHGNIIGGALHGVPAEKAKELMAKYPLGVSIIATCSGGQQDEHDRFGTCYSEMRDLAKANMEANHG